MDGRDETKVSHCEPHRQVLFRGNLTKIRVIEAKRKGETQRWKEMHWW